MTGQSVIDLMLNVETRASKTKPSIGIVRVKSTGCNPHGVTVIEFTRTFMVYRRGHVPKVPRGSASR